MLLFTVPEVKRAVSAFSMLNTSTKFTSNRFALPFLLFSR